MGKTTKIWLVIVLSLILLGAIIFTGVMTMLKWDFRKLSTINYVTNTFDISESFDSICIDTKTSDINIVKSSLPNIVEASTILAPIFAVNAENRLSL